MARDEESGAAWLCSRSVRRLGGFHRRYPDLALHVLSSPEIEDFSNPDINMAIRYGGGSYPGMISHLLLEERVFPVCSPSLLNGRLIRPFQDSMPAQWSYFAVMPEDRTHDGKVTAFINWIGEEA